MKRLIIVMIVLLFCVSCAGSGAPAGQPDEETTVTVMTVSGTTATETSGEETVAPDTVAPPILDYSLAVETPYAARRTITDRDTKIMAYYENPPNETYYWIFAVIEVKDNSGWTEIRRFDHVFYRIELGEPLAAGFDYRLMIYVNDSLPVSDNYFGIAGEFFVARYEDLPEPEWDASRLEPTPYGAEAWSESIWMAVDDPVINSDHINLTYTVTADTRIGYGDRYEIEVLLGGEWYRAPPGPVAVGDLLYVIEGNIETASQTQVHCLVCDIGVLPAGRYRMVKEFHSPDIPWPEYKEHLEYAYVEFEVEETLEWMDYEQPPG